MIFNFDDFPNNEQENAKLAAKSANDKVRKDGHMVYGNAFQEKGKLILSNFTEVQKETDTHCAVLMGLTTMGTLPVVKAKVEVDEITQVDIDRARIEALESQNRALEHENKTKRKR